MLKTYKTYFLLITLALLLIPTLANADNIIRLDCPIDVPTPDGDSVLIPVYITNDVSIGAFTLPLNWNSTDVVITSFDLTGSCLPMGMQFMFTMTIYPGEQKVLPGSIDFSGVSPLTPQNDALLFSMWAQIPTGASQQCVDIDTGFIAPAGTWVFAKQGGGNAYPDYVDCGVGDIVIAGAVCGIQPPVVSTIPNQTIPEGSSLCFDPINLDDYVEDLDNSDDEITWIARGEVDLTVTINGSRVAEVCAPDLDWSGYEDIWFIACDPDVQCDSTFARFRVNAVNDPPVVLNIPGQTVDEGGSFATINLDNYVTDSDNDPDEMTWTYSGNTNLSVTIDGNRVATIGILNSDWNGVETITFKATDPGSLFDSDDATFTVNPVNDAPVVSDIPGLSVPEGSNFTVFDLDDYVTDVETPDADIDWVASGNTELTVTIDPVSHEVTIGIPHTDWNGDEAITFTATDGGEAGGDELSDFDDAIFEVTAVNDPPVVSDIPNQVVIEGNPFAKIHLDDYVEDIDNADSEMDWTYSGNTKLTVNIDVNRIATIEAPVDWEGVETITFKATDPGDLFDSDDASFEVVAEPDPPVVTNIPDQTIDEDALFATINLDDYVNDPDTPDDQITWTVEAPKPLGLTVTIDVNRIATVVIPNANWNGSGSFIFIAADPVGLADTTDPATFTVNPVNDAPVVSDIPDQTVLEGGSFATFDLDDYVTDIETPDGDMTWTYSGNNDLSVSIDAGTHVATVSIPDPEWSGSEEITFTATDKGEVGGDELSASDAATFSVTPVNDPPKVGDIPDESIAEGGSFTPINLDDYVNDADNTPEEMTWSYSGNTELSVTINVNRVATIGIPHIDWNGDETITFRATDPGGLYHSNPATFTVDPVNDDPVARDTTVVTVEDEAVDAQMQAYDVDGDPLTYKIIDGPSFGTVDPFDPLTGEFTYTPNTGFIGEDIITFGVTDEVKGTDEGTVTIKVFEPSFFAFTPDTVNFHANEYGPNPDDKLVLVENASPAGGEFTWELAEDADWLTIDQDTGTTPTTLTFTVDIDELLPNTYVAYVIFQELLIAASTGGGGAKDTVTVIFELDNPVSYDSVIVSNESGEREAEVIVTIWANNSAPTAEYNIPILYDSNILIYNCSDFGSTRSTIGQSEAPHYPELGAVCLKTTFPFLGLERGSGVIAYMSFTIRQDANLGDLAALILVPNEAFNFILNEDHASDTLTPHFTAGWIKVSDGTDAEDDQINFPTDYALMQNYPNPFNPETMIQYSLPVGGFVKLTIYNILGQEVSSLVDEYQAAGQHNVTWNGQDADGLEVKSGVYFYKLSTDGFQMTRKMVLMK